MMTDTELTNNLKLVQQQVGEAAQAVQRSHEEITLVAVSKTHDAATIDAVINAGQQCFGENRVQEANDKWPSLKNRYPGVKLHLIGPLQSNKARRALQLFDVIETVDRPKLARSLARLMDETGLRPDCYVQINTGEEAQKAGILPAEADAFISLCQNELKLPIVGLMCIPPVNEDAALHFALLREIARRNGLKGLSMGMSSDYATAIRFGATSVRVGSAIFGDRKPWPPTDS